MDIRPVIVGNWKMQLSHKAAVEVARSVRDLLKAQPLTSDVVLCPSYPTIPAVQEVVQGVEQVGVGAQNISLEERGAFTGQVSVQDVKPFVSWCIVGHSEVKAAMGDDDQMIAQKAALLLNHDISPIICIGETEEERNLGQTIAVVEKAMKELLQVIPRTSFPKVVLCYEPVWAISSNREEAPMPDPQEILSIVMVMRKQLAAAFDAQMANRVRILYGGSVNEHNAADYAKEPGIDGVLVGSASTHPKQLVDIVAAVQKVWTRA